MTGPVLSVSPEPTNEEAAAIAAALEVTRPMVIVAASEPPESRWRFSGRWWTKPVPSRRSRP